MAIKGNLPFLFLFLLSTTLVAYNTQEQGSRSEGSQQGQQQQDNPYYFHRQSFRTKHRSQEGSVSVLQRFSKRSNLLRGLENYRLAFFESNPNTFSIPNHWDADTLCFVMSGRGTITILEENDKETYNIERGDIIRARPGTTVYITNSDNNQKLNIVTLVRPVGVPGKFQVFFGPGGRDPESYYNAFSDDILEAAFNTPQTKLRKLFQGQNKGTIIKASRQQIEALGRHASSSEHTPWPLPPFGRESKGTYNLFNKRPSFSNDFGELYLVDHDDYKQLQDLDVAVSFANITRGAMIGPYYNSRATKVAVVIDGSGYIEMACPHLSRQQGQQGRQEEEQEEEGRQGRQEQEGREGRQEQEGRPGRQEESEEGQEGRQEQEGRQGGQEQEGRPGRQEESQEGRSSPRYQKASARVSRGDVYVTPASHPFVAVASRDQNLQIVCFEINAENNQKYQLAGKKNVLRQLEREAKELAFAIPARQVDEILEKQNEQWFFPGPHQRQQGRDEE